MARYGGFLIFQHGGCLLSWIYKIVKFSRSTRLIWSVCVNTPNIMVISHTVVEIWRFFKMVAVRHLGFSNFKGYKGKEGQYTSPYQILCQSVEPLLRYCDWSIFLSKWQPSAILDLLCACLDHPQRALGGLYRCAKFGWNGCNSFDIMQVWIICELRLKTPLHAPKMEVLGDLTPKWGAASSITPKRQ